MNLYAIQLPGGSIAMSGPYVLATESEAQADRMAHARDGTVLTFSPTAQPSAKDGVRGPVAVVGVDGYPSWLVSWLESPSYVPLPQGTKLYATTTVSGLVDGVTDEMVNVFQRVYGQNFVDGRSLKVPERIKRALEAAIGREVGDG